MTSSPLSADHPAIGPCHSGGEVPIGRGFHYPQSAAAKRVRNSGWTRSLELPAYIEHYECSWSQNRLSSGLAVRHLAQFEPDTLRGSERLLETRSPESERATFFAHLVDVSEEFLLEARSGASQGPRDQRLRASIRRVVFHQETRQTLDF